MKDTLFDIPEQLSPRLIWMKRHNLKAFYDPDCPDADMGPWFAGYESDVLCMGSGKTEEEALLDFAAFEGLPDWRQDHPASADTASTEG